MKRIITILFLLAAIVTTTHAYDFMVDGLCYNYNDDGVSVSVTKQFNYSSDNYSGLSMVTIPSNVYFEGNTYSVTAIDEEAFSYCTGLTSVTIPKSIKKIGYNAFHNCSSLTMVNISDLAAWCNIDFYLGGSSNPLYYAHNLYLNGNKITNLVIPNTVTTIGGWAFCGCYSITSVSIPNSVTYIDWGAFEYCTGLTSLNIPNSVTSIGGWAFSGCSGLTSLNIPSSVTSILIGAFSNCSNLNTINIPSSVTSIGENAFSETPWYDNQQDGIVYAGMVAYKYKGAMPQNTSIVLKEGCTGIADQAFYSYFSSLPLCSITIPNSVKTIGMQAFSNCSNLTSVTIPNSVTRIGIQAFRDCHGLKSVTIGNSVTEIGDGAFEYCNSLTSLTIGNSVTKIGELAFSKCNSLTSVNIPNSVTAIGNKAFMYCDNLSSVSIESNITNIGEQAFAYCNNSLAFYCNKQDPITISNNVFQGYEYGGNHLYVFVPIGSSNNYQNSNVWNNFNIIEYDFNTNFMFDGLCYRINNNKAVVTYQIHTENGPSYIKLQGDLNIPANVTHNELFYTVTEIDNFAFRGCSEINSVTIPNTITTIGKFVFSGCTSITTANISSSVISIGENAFRNCSSLTSVFVPNSVISIGNNAFQNCTSLASIILSNSLTSINNYTFYNCPKLASIAIPPSVTTIGEYAFYGCSDLTSVDIGNSVTSIGGGAFECCTELTSITIPNSVTEIGYKAFAGCSGLASITIPNSVTEISYEAFAGCSGLTSITIPNLVTSIGSSAFSGCSGLTSLTIGNSVTEIGENAFYRCSGLTSITIPNSVTSIENSAFSYCSGLTSIIVESENTKYDSRDNCNAIIETATNTLITGCKNTIIPNSVTSIGSYAFNGCTGLTSVTIGIYVTSVGSYAFEGCSNLRTVNWNAKSCADLDYQHHPFYNLTSITSFVIGNNVERIPAFICYSLTGLISITIPNSVTSIGDHAFSSCTSLTTVFSYINNLNQVGIGIDVFNVNAIQNCVLYVPWESLSVYKTTYPWKYFHDIIAGCVLRPNINNDFFPISGEIIHIRGDLECVVEVPFWLFNMGSISGIQFDISLPDGVTIPSVDGMLDVWLDENRMARNHSLDISELVDNTYRILVSSPTNRSFNDSIGNILYMRFVIPQYHSIGNYNFTLSNIVCVAPDETQINVSNDQSLKMRYKYLVGDSDCDVMVDIADYTMTALYILSRPVDTFYSDAADVSGDNQITVTDLVGITNISLGIRPQEYRPAPAIYMNNAVTDSAPMLNATIEGDNIVTLGLDNDIPLAGLQLDLQLPQGMTLADASLEGRAANYQLGTSLLADGRVRLLVSSFGDKDIEAGNDAIIKLVLDGENVNNDMLYITGAQAASRDLKSYEIDDVSLQVGTTSINDIGVGYEKLNIYGKGNTIVIDSPSKMLIQVVHVNGMVMPVEVKPGHNTIDVGGHGVYIIRVGSSVYKVRL